MSAQFIIVLLALIFMVIAVSPPAPRPPPAISWNINWMCLSFAMLILAWLVGVGTFFPLHR